MQPLPPSRNLLIREVAEADYAALADIYNHYIANSIATFEEQPITAEDMGARIKPVVDTNLPWLVGESSDGIAGYAYAAPWKPRSAYRHSVEISVYLDPQHTGAGLGTGLYQSLFAALRQREIHSVAGGIALPNPACVALHEKFGMRKVAHFKEVGFKFNRWIDVAYWQRLL